MPKTAIPALVLKAIKLASSLLMPPIILSTPFSMLTPNPFGLAVAASTPTPIKFPAISL